MASCVRGCAVPHDCDGCVAGKALHEPVRSPATDRSGLICSRCEQRLRQMLMDIHRESAELHTRRALEIRHTGEREGSYRNKPAGSPALIRLEVMTLTDPYAGWDPETGLGSIDGQLSWWAARVRDDANGLSDAPDDWAPWVPWLLESDDKLVAYSGIADLYEAVAQLWGHVMRAAGVEQSPVRPLARCTSSWSHPGVVPGSPPRVVECGATIKKRPSDTTVRCQRCGRIYAALDQLRLRLAAGPKSLSVREAAQVCEVAPATIRSWISDGHVARDAAGRVSSAQLLKWWTRRNHQRARGVGSATRVG